MIENKIEKTNADKWIAAPINKMSKIETGNNQTDRIRPGRKNLKIMSPTAASDTKKQFVGF